MSPSDFEHKIVVRPFRDADVVGAHALSTRIGWSQTIEDWHWLAGQGQGYAATLADQLVGVTLYWIFGASVASIGAVMVDDAYRGRGIAGQLLERCLADLDGRSLMLYATEAGKPLYVKRGFVPFETIEQHQGVVRPLKSPRLPAGDVLRTIDADAREIIRNMAELASGIDRSKVIESLLDRSDGVLLVREGRPSGFALYRRYGLGFAVGPVVAEDETGARSLIQHCLVALSGQFARIDIPSSPEMSGWLDESGLRHSGSALGMLHGALPPSLGPLRRIAIATQATG